MEAPSSSDQHRLNKNNNFSMSSLLDEDQNHHIRRRNSSFGCEGRINNHQEQPYFLQFSSSTFERNGLNETLETNEGQLYFPSFIKKHYECI